MKKILLNILYLFLILFGLFWALDLLFTTVYQKGNYTKIQWLYKMKHQEFDFALNGSSRAYTTVNIESIEQETKLNGINISVDGSTITDQYLMLKIFLENNNTLKKLYLQVDPWSTNMEQISHFAIPKFFPYLKEETVFEHFKQFGAKWYAYRYIPFFRYAEYNTIWGGHQLLNDMFHLFPQDFDEDGCYFYTETEYRGTKELQDLRYEIDGKYKFLNQIITLCDNYDIELILFTAPVANIRINEEYMANMEQFRLMMEGKGVKYFNFGHIYGNEVKNFTDEIHLNPYGVSDFTERIQECILDKKEPLEINLAENINSKKLSTKKGVNK